METQMQGILDVDPSQLQAEVQQRQQQRAILKRDLLAWRRHLAVLVRHTPSCLPEKWEVRVDPEHRAFFVDHGNQRTTFDPPPPPPGILQRLQEQMAGRTSGRNSPQPNQGARGGGGASSSSSSSSASSASSVSEAASAGGTPEALAKMRVVKKLRAEWGDDHWRSLSSDAKNAAVTDTLRREAEVQAAAVEASTSFVPGVVAVDEATGVRWRMLDVQRQKHFKFYMGKLIELTERMEQLRLESDQRSFAVRGKVTEGGGGDVDVLEFSAPTWCHDKLSACAPTSPPPLPLPSRPPPTATPPPARHQSANTFHSSLRHSLEGNILDEVSAPPKRDVTHSLATSRPHDLTHTLTHHP